MREIKSNKTVLSGDLNFDDEDDGTYNNENVYHVVKGGSNPILDGFVITKEMPTG